MGQQQSHTNCIENQLLAGKYKLTKYLGGGANGQVFMSCVTDKNGQCILGNDVAVKKQFIDEQSYRFRDDIYSRQALAHSIWAELFCLQLCRLLTSRLVCQNLPQWFDWYVCDKCKITELQEQLARPIDLEQSQSTNCVFIVNKLANDGDFWKWLSVLYESKFYYNALFQIFAGLYALQKIFNLTHGDFHPGNVLVHSCAAGGYWKYQIDGNSFYLENLGFVFTVWDFGNVKIPGIIEPLKSKPLSSKQQANRLKTDHETFISEIFYNDEHYVSVPESVGLFLEQILTAHVDLRYVFGFFNMFKQRPDGIQKLATFKFDQRVGFPKLSD